MDLTTMTDIELNNLMLQAGDELEKRRTARSVSGRLAKVIDDAAESGVSDTAVDAAIVQAKAKRGPLPPKPDIKAPLKTDAKSKPVV
jgi:hypothetical protein